MAKYARALKILVPLTLLALLFAAVAAQAQTTGGATPEGNAGTELTTEQRARFEEGASEVAGLSDEEIALALKDPELTDDIPVGTSNPSTVTSRPS